MNHRFLLSCLVVVTFLMLVLSIMATTTGSALVGYQKAKMQGAQVALAR